MLKKHVLVLSLFIFSPLLAAAQIPEGLPVTSLPVINNGDLLVEDFEKESTGELPTRWFDQKGEKVPAYYTDKNQTRYLYEVMQEDGNKFLRFDGVKGVHLNFPLKEVENLSIREHPILSWRWRAHILPEGAREDKNSLNDVTASIYVVYSLNWLRIPRVIRYTWSSTLPVGKELSMNFNQMKILVVESGRENTGKWKTFERNIYADYRKFFGDHPPNKPLAILILSDGVSTGSPVRADYDNIILKTAGRTE
ncbi:MAG: DUF3047 domain-containing protein [Balneolaceae bacterium]